MAELVQDVSKQNYDGLIGGTYPHIITGSVTLAAGSGQLKRGTVLGKVTASGNYTIADSSKTDGSQIGSAILINDTDATEAVKAEVYLTGMFNTEKLTFGGSDTREKQEDNLRNYGIYLTTLK